MGYIWVDSVAAGCVASISFSFWMTSVSSACLSVWTRHYQFFKFQRRRGLHGLPSALRVGGTYGPYEGLAAGITDDGILCGFYQVDGFKARY
ncbi:hypothetical protein PC116_g18263 [Phytophthora cactorum]|uniref:Uncharacterized protein n=1 Tax=Phytophthora cactorum TaxID=29920 RepID=A0A8T1KCZ8_9STRA|nr:hypothetical protein PC112_g20130 [Phytophthora cactorum]KAG2815162.1 hypothetical protein PC111_g13674 [Phytophthora cactorum]KAG2853129.1 hypothetical protein PC113_g14425 [Phytophthora cactorum]KAG2895121.1 hypothetical protein PC115_g17942 [Phytophthora cactorum]KAG2895850.1 hypothetical protein PC114_g15353 [Phytophthora cactorum]